MTSLAKRIAAKLSEREKLHVDVEEWGEPGQPVRLYFDKFNIRDMSKLQRKYKDFATNPTLDAMVDAIISKVEDEQGEKVFTIEDRPTLMGAEVSTIARIFGAIFSGPTVEDMEKN
jgi:hypothetical protein